MDIKLGENIRTLRKERSLTQEQFSEVLGVSVGAVYKWESGISIPELPLIIEMADFFDTSVDSLLGYEMKDNQISTTAKRIHVYHDTLDPEGIEEAEKALKKFPNSFEIVYESAHYFMAYSAFTSNADLLKRGQELLLQCIPLLSRNKDPQISEATLHGELAESYISQGDWKKGVKYMKQHNAKGMYNSKIGLLYAMNEDQNKDAPGYLSYGLIGVMNPLINAIFGLCMVYSKNGDFQKSIDILNMGIDFNNSFRNGDKPNYMDRITACYLTDIAYFEFIQGEKEKAEKTLKKAFQTAEKFDADPDYDTRNMKFIMINEVCKAYDSLGDTAMDAVNNIIATIGAPEFTSFQESLRAKWQKKLKQKK